MVMEEPLTNQSDRAYSVLIRKIALCELPPGAVLNERAAAAELGMSRTPFRQAIHRLTVEGLTTTIPKKGIQVTLLDYKILADHMMVREALEAEMVRWVIEHDLPVDFGVLRRLIASMKDAAAKNDNLRFLRADEEFHLGFMNAAGNEAAVEAVHRSWIQVNRARYLAPPDFRDRGEVMKEHSEILSALSAKDVTRAEAAVRKHISESRRRLRGITERIPSAFVENRSVVA